MISSHGDDTSSPPWVIAASPHQSHYPSLYPCRFIYRFCCSKTSLQHKKKNGTAQTTLPLGSAFDANSRTLPGGTDAGTVGQLVFLQTCAWIKAKVIYDGWCWRQWHSNGLQVWTGWGVCRWERVTQMVSATGATWSGFGVILFLHKGRKKKPQPWCGSRFRLADHECSVGSKCGHSTQSDPLFPPFLDPSDTRTGFFFLFFSSFFQFVISLFLFWPWAILSVYNPSLLFTRKKGVLKKEIYGK